MTKLTLYCVVEGEPVASSFSIKIESNETVENLKEHIQAKRIKAFGHIDACLLELMLVTVTNGTFTNEIHFSDPFITMAKLFPAGFTQNTRIYARAWKRKESNSSDSKLSNSEKLPYVDT